MSRRWRSNGLKRGENGLEIYVMCEIPNNVIQIDAFAKVFDGFSIGSNDLTQLTLGVDRDSEIVAFDFDERDPGMLEMLRLAVGGAKRNGRQVGICGEAPANYPEIAQIPRRTRHRFDQRQPVKLTAHNHYRSRRGSGEISSPAGGTPPEGQRVQMRSARYVVSPRPLSYSGTRPRDVPFAKEMNKPPEKASASFALRRPGSGGAAGER